MTSRTDEGLLRPATRAQELQLVHLLGVTDVAGLDSFTVQQTLDDDSLLWLPASGGPADVKEWHRRQGERLPVAVRPRLEAAAGILRELEARHPRRKDEIQQRYWRQLEQSKHEMSVELNRRPARTTRHFQVSKVWPIRRQYTYFFAEVNHLQLHLSDGRRSFPLAERPTMSQTHMEKQSTYAGFTEVWKPAEPEALFLMRLDWLRSRVSFDLPDPEVSGLERWLGKVKTISELILLVTGVAEAAMLARLALLATCAGMRAAAVRRLRAALVRRTAANPALQGEALGMRVISSASRGLDDMTQLGARGLGPAGRGIELPVTPAARGLTAERAGAAPPRTAGGKPTGAAATLTRPQLSWTVLPPGTQPQTVLIDTSVVDWIRRRVPGVEQQYVTGRAAGIDFAIPRPMYTEAIRGKWGPEAREIIERLGIRIDEGFGIASRVPHYQRAVEQEMRFEGMLGTPLRKGGQVRMGDLVGGAHTRAANQAFWTCDPRSKTALKQLGVRFWPPLP